MTAARPRPAGNRFVCSARSQEHGMAAVVVDPCGGVFPVPASRPVSASRQRWSTPLRTSFGMRCPRCREPARATLRPWRCVGVDHTSAGRPTTPLTVSRKRSSPRGGCQGIVARVAMVTGMVAEAAVKRRVSCGSSSAPPRCWYLGGCVGRCVCVLWMRQVFVP